MAYAARSDMVNRFGAAEMERLAPSGDDRSVGAIADAGAEIDAELARRFALPLSAGPWPLLESIACDIARLRLYDQAAPDVVLGRGSAARKRLRRIADGDLPLVNGDGVRAPEIDSILVDTSAATFADGGLDEYTDPPR